MKTTSPCNGSNDGQWVLSTVWTDGWKEKGNSSLGMQLCFLRMVLATGGICYSDGYISIDGPAWTWTARA